MARPSRGVRVPLLCRPPGIGGRSNGAGDDMLGGEEPGEGKFMLEDFSRLASLPMKDFIENIVICGSKDRHTYSIDIDE
jgi:hypothetical protein